MSKILKYSFLLIIILALLAPLGVGMFMQNQYNMAIASFNKMYAGKIKIEGSFSRGYMRSNAKTKITSLVQSSKSFDLTHDILHGPVIINFKGWNDANSYIPRGYKLAVVNTKLDNNLNMALTMVYSGQAAYSIISEFAYDGAGNTLLRINPLTFSLGNGRELVWQEIILTIANTKHFTSIDSKMLIPLIHYTGSAGDDLKEIKISTFKIDYKLDLNANLKGAMNVHLDDAFALASDHNIFNIHDVNVVINDEKNNELINLDMNYSFDNLKFVNDEYGPLALTFNLKNISAKAIEKIAEVMPQNNTNMQHEVSVLIPPEQILEFLATRPALNTDLKLGMAKGKIDLISTLEVGGKDLTSINPQLIADTLSATAILKVNQALVYAFMAQFAESQIHAKEKDFKLNNKDALAKNPYSLTLQDMQATIEGWIINLLDILKKQSLIVETKDMISTHVIYDKKVLTVNDKPKQISEIMELQKLLNVNVVKADKDNNSGPNPAPVASENKITVVPAFKAPSNSQQKTNKPTLNAPKPVPTTPATPTKPSATKTPSPTKSTSSSSTSSSSSRTR